IMVEETAVLGDADRRRVDSRMKRSLGPAGLRSLRTEARALSAEMDAEAAAKRAAKAASNRRVSPTPLEDGMGRISAILPLPQAVAAFESLRRAAEATVVGGAAYGRSRAQVLADTVVERLSGRPSASAVPAEAHLVVEAESLLGRAGAGLAARLRSAAGQDRPRVRHRERGAGPHQQTLHPTRRRAARGDGGTGPGIHRPAAPDARLPRRCVP